LPGGGDLAQLRVGTAITAAAAGVIAPAANAAAVAGRSVSSWVASSTSRLASPGCSRTLLISQARSELAPALTAAPRLSTSRVEASFAP
jgi:hypothetical protein